MPSYRSITVSLVSQHDIRTIPEFKPPTGLTDPFIQVPALVDPEDALVSVYIPIYPSSQFWLHYSITPPCPPGILWYFKLSINGTHIVSWGCDENSNYQGKAVFGMFQSGTRSYNDSQIERRALCFGSSHSQADTCNPADLGDLIEIKVFRSNGRTRKEPELNDYQKISGKTDTNRHKSPLHSPEKGINLLNAGPLPVGYPRRFYKYSLIDPLDQPFATFHLYARSWEQLEALGVISPSGSVATSSRSSVERPVDQKRSSNTIDSYYGSPAKYANDLSADASTDSISRGPNEHDGTIADDGVVAAVTAGSSIYSQDSQQDQDLSSPLRIPSKSTPSYLRPSTPPPASSLNPPNTSPHTFSPSAKRVGTKESFTSLIRNRMANPDVSTPHLRKPEAIEGSKQPGLLSRRRLPSMDLFKNVVSGATTRRKGSGQEDEDGKVERRLPDEMSKKGKSACYGTSDEIDEENGGDHRRRLDEVIKGSENIRHRPSDEAVQTREGEYLRSSDKLMQESDRIYHHSPDEAPKKSRGARYDQRRGDSQYLDTSIWPMVDFDSVLENHQQRMRQIQREAGILPEDERMSGDGMKASAEAQRVPADVMKGDLGINSRYGHVGLDNTNNSGERKTFFGRKGKTATEEATRDDLNEGSLTEKELKKALKQQKKYEKERQKERKQEEKEEKKKGKERRARSPI